MSKKDKHSNSNSKCKNCTTQALIFREVLKSGHFLEIKNAKEPYFSLEIQYTMANRIIYSCDSSDMDVSDTDDGAQICQQSQQQSPNSTNSTLISSATRMEIDGYESDDSFHTAHNSPQSNPSEELEPGQISEMYQTFSDDQRHMPEVSRPPPDPLEKEVATLESQLRFNQSKVFAIAEQIKQYMEEQEKIKLKLLEHRVRNSIVRNRKPVRLSTVKKDELPLAPTHANNEPTTTTTNRNKGKAPAESRFILTPNLAKENSTTERMNQQPSFLVPEPNPLASTPNFPLNPLKRVASDSESIPPGKVPKKKRGKKQNKRAKSNPAVAIQPSASGKRLVEAVIDKPFSKRYVEELQKDDNSSSDEMYIDNGNETKKERKQREKEEMITEEEKALIATDIPRYPGKSIPRRRELARVAHKEVTAHLNFNPPSLKSMRISLVNLKETSILQDGRLSADQEVMVKGLIRKIHRLVEDYMTLPEEVYCRAARSLPPPGEGPERLPDHFYGNLGSLSYEGPDVSHHELYKAIRHFDNITNPSAKKKSDQYLLTSGRKPPQRILRTCDPANLDETSTIPFDMHMKNNPTKEEIENEAQIAMAKTRVMDTIRIAERAKAKEEKTKRKEAEEAERKRKRIAKLNARRELASIKSKAPVGFITQIGNRRIDQTPDQSYATVQPETTVQPHATPNDQVDFNQLYEYYAGQADNSQCIIQMEPKIIIIDDDKVIETDKPDPKKSTPHPPSSDSPQVIVDVAQEPLRRNGKLPDTQQPSVMSETPATTPPVTKPGMNHPTSSSSTQVKKK